MDKNDPIETARRIVQSHFPSCRVAILSGSIVQNMTPTSDLDLVIVDESHDDYFRKSFVAYGWPVEVVVLHGDNYRFYFNEAIYCGIPSLLNMCADGIVLRDDGSAAELIREAREDLLSGPLPIGEEESRRLRYEITETLTDFIGGVKKGEHLFNVTRLTQLLAEFILRANGRWLGEGKWMFRCLQAFDPHVADSLLQAVEAYYAKGSKTELIEFAEAQLALHGGAVFEGFQE